MKAIILFSGGLDSLLAAKIIKDSGIDLFALNFVSPFCKCHRKDGCSAVVHLKKMGIDYKIIYIKEEYLKMITSPKFGRGRNMNPCLDCRILMFRKAKAVMKEINAAFIISGEVLGQRPMSQQRRQLRLIETEAGLSGFILRPLSAKLLPETIPEREGWVKSDILLDFAGRMRSPQIDKACELGIKDYPCPAGGCLLTDAGFSRRIKDLMKYSQLSLEDVELLKLGRHFRINDKSKLVIGRNELENERLLKSARDKDVCFISNDVPGPIGLWRDNSGCHAAGVLENTVAPLVAYYCDRDSEGAIMLDYFIFPQEKVCRISSKIAGKQQVEQLRI